MSAFVISALVFTGCDEDEDAWVDITDAQNVQNKLKIPKSQTGKGDLPEPTSGNKDLGTISSVGVSAGNTVILPILYNSSDNALKVFLQVIGAEGYISASVTSCSSSLASGRYGYISIGIPSNINDGSFKIQYLIQDGSGNYSNMVITTINVNNDIKTCSNASASGSDGLTFTTVDLGNKSGEVKIYYDTYTVPDRIDIFQGTTWVTGTGKDPNCPIPPICNCSSATAEDGFVGKSGYFEFNYNPSKGKLITVVVSGCLGGGTAWEWRLVDAPNCE